MKKTHCKYRSFSINTKPNYLKKSYQKGFKPYKLTFIKRRALKSQSVVEYYP